MTELKYLQSTGTQYLNTGIKPNTTTVVKAGIMSDVATGGVLIGNCFNDNSDYRLFNYSQTAYFDYGSGRISGSNINTGTYYDVEMGNYYLKLNGSTVLSGSTVGSGSYSNYDIYTMYSNIESAKAQMKLYYLQIYNGGNLVFDGIPVEDENSVVCLYDRVSQTYIYNSGTGDFIAGYFPSALTPQELYDLAMTSNNFENTHGHRFIASASSVIDSSRQPYKAFDGTGRTGEYECWHPTSGVPQWIKLQIDDPMIILGFTMKNRSVNVEHPWNITFQGSNDGTNWDNLTVIYWHETGSGLTKNVTVPRYSTGYTYFRWYITEVTSSPYGVIAKIIFTDVETPSTGGDKYLLESGGNYYKVSEGSLTNVGSTLNAQLFADHGMSEIPDWSDYSSLSNPSVLCWSENHLVDMIATTTGLPAPQTIQSQNFSLDGASGIASVDVTETGSPKYAFSVDGGTTYKIWNGSSWETSSGVSSDMTGNTVEAITESAWASLITGASTLKIRFTLFGAADSVTSIEVSVI